MPRQRAWMTTSEIFRARERATFDLDRRTTTRLMSFGVGRHSCMGELLACTNLSIMLKTMLKRLGPISVDLANSVRHQSIATRGFDEMPIAWGR